LPVVILKHWDGRAHLNGIVMCQLEMQINGSGIHEVVARQVKLWLTKPMPDKAQECK
jgi:hypothetical protein